MWILERTPNHHGRVKTAVGMESGACFKESMGEAQ